MLLEMQTQALRQFDQMVASTETKIRDQMASAGLSGDEIERYILACQPNLKAQRARVPSMVTIEMLKAGAVQGNDNERN